MKFNKTLSQIITCIKDKKGEDIVVLDIRRLSSLTDYFIICTSDSDPKTKAITSHIKKDLSKSKMKPIQIEGVDHFDWVLMDYFDTVVHIFRKETREFYNIERLWADAKVVKIKDD